MGSYTVSKLQAAKRQIDAAIYLLTRHDDHVAALTLAAAAAGILEGEGSPEPGQFFQKVRAGLAEKYDISPDIVGRVLNESRNWLKHWPLGHDVNRDHDWLGGAIAEIMRAILNFPGEPGTLPEAWAGFFAWVRRCRPDMVPNLNGLSDAT